jgi:hypothetical protein
MRHSALVVMRYESSPGRIPHMFQDHQAIRICGTKTMLWKTTAVQTKMKVCFVFLVTEKMPPSWRRYRNKTVNSDFYMYETFFLGDETNGTTTGTNVSYI